MLSRGHILAILVVSASLITVLSIDAQQELTIPEWVKNNALWWGQGEITDADFISAINFLIEQKQVRVPSSDADEQAEYAQRLQTKIIAMQDANEKLKEENQRLKQENAQLYSDYKLYYDLYMGSDNSYSDYDDSYQASSEPQINPDDYCYGYADCFVGTVTKVIDGDTIDVDGQRIRLALVNSPEYGDWNGYEAKSFIDSVCPVGTTVLVDEDDGQTQGSYGRMIAVVYCGDTSYNLNEAAIASGFSKLDVPYCANSEFGTHSWAINYGCGYEAPSYSPPSYTPPKSSPPKSEPPKSEPPESTPTPSCDPSYPDFCIPPPPDLNCSDISQKDFTVYQPDPHHFDGDKDGIGCES